MSVLERLKEWRSEQCKSQLAFLEMYVALKESCVGINGVTILSGTNKFELDLQGFDIFEMSPDFEEDLAHVSSNFASSATSLA